MKAKFAKELKLMIDNEIKQQRIELEHSNKFENKVRRQMSLERVEKVVKTKRDLSSIDSESIQSEFAGSKVDKYLKAATGNAAKEQKI